MLTRQGGWQRAYPGCQAPNSRQTRRELDDARSCSDTASSDLGAAAEKAQGSKQQPTPSVARGDWCPVVPSRFRILVKKLVCACRKETKREKVSRSCGPGKPFIVGEQTPRPEKPGHRLTGYPPRGRGCQIEVLGGDESSPHLGIASSGYLPKWAWRGEISEDLGRRRVESGGAIGRAALPEREGCSAQLSSRDLQGCIPPFGLPVWRGSLKLHGDVTITYFCRHVFD